MTDTTFALVSAPALIAALLAVPLPERAALALELEPIVCISEASIGAEGLSQGCDPFAVAGEAPVAGTCVVAEYLGEMMHAAAAAELAVAGPLEGYIRDTQERYNVSRRDALDSLRDGFGSDEAVDLLARAEVAWYDLCFVRDELAPMVGNTGLGRAEECEGPVYVEPYLSPAELAALDLDDLPF